jgi:hypothetical protein
MATRGRVGKTGWATAVLAATLVLPGAGCDDGGSSGPEAVVRARDLVCNQVMGVSVTGDWFTAGFESALDGDRWQVVSQSHAFIDLWDDPADAVWSIAPVSPCVEGATDPDRVLFTGCNWTFTTVQEWTDAFEAVVANLKAKYPGLKRIDLLTMLRAPGNEPCFEGGSTEVVVAPFIDEAIANVVAAHPGFVTAAPKFFAPNCDLFFWGGPHFTDEGKAVAAKIFSDWYAAEP